MVSYQVLLSSSIIVNNVLVSICKETLKTGSNSAFSQLNHVNIIFFCDKKMLKIMLNNDHADAQAARFRLINQVMDGCSIVLSGYVYFKFTVSVQ